MFRGDDLPAAEARLQSEILLRTDLGLLFAAQRELQEASEAIQ